MSGALEPPAKSTLVSRSGPLSSSTFSVARRYGRLVPTALLASSRKKTEPWPALYSSANAAHSPVQSWKSRRLTPGAFVGARSRPLSFTAPAATRIGPVGRGMSRKHPCTVILPTVTVRGAHCWAVGVVSCLTGTVRVIVADPRELVTLSRTVLSPAVGKVLLTVVCAPRSVSKTPSPSRSHSYLVIAAPPSLTVEAPALKVTRLVVSGSLGE
jgi:hypothetical protein